MGMTKQAGLSSRDVADALTIAVACISVTSSHSAMLGGIWAAISVVFVFRATREDTWSAGVARLIATSVSVVLCLLYLWFIPFTVAGMAALIGLGTLAMMLLGRRDGIVTTGITTVVIMVVAALSPVDAWHQPILRLVDTIVGIGIGVASKWAASRLY
jgi:uncharacterized membrane protein YccC